MYCKLTKKEVTEADLVKALLKQEGFEIVKEEDLILDTDEMGEEIKGLKVTLADGRVFVMKHYESDSSGGNWGCDYYDWYLESENPSVKQINLDE